LMFYICGLMSQICDEYLVNSLEIFAKEFDLPEDVAGVTFLTLGGSLPELAISIFATAEGNEIGIGAIIGSALLNMTIGVVVVCLLTPRKQFVRKQAIIRDLIAYLLALGVVLAFRQNGNVNLIESVTMIVLYFIFVAFLFVFNHYFGTYSIDLSHDEQKERGRARHAKARHSDSEEDVQDKEPLVNDPDVDPSSVEPKDQKDTCWRHTWSALTAFNDALYTPSGWLFSWTIPDCSKKERRHLYPITFGISMIYIFGISFALMTLVQWIGCQLHVEEAFSGLIILALGASLPDLITMGTAARRGHGPMAMSGLIGSNVFDILVGLGLPWVVYVSMYGELNISSLRVLEGVYFCCAAVIVLFGSLLFTGMELKKIVCILPFILYCIYVPVEVIG